MGASAIASATIVELAARADAPNLALTVFVWLNLRRQIRSLRDAAVLETEREGGPEASGALD